MSKEIANQNGGYSYNVITSGTKITGKINTDSDFKLDGEIEGDIICKGKLVIGSKGYLKGSITCANAEILGTVEGNLKVSDTLTLRSSATLNGDLATKSLVVEPNAVFNGTCSMKEDAAKTPKAAKTEE